MSRHKFEDYPELAEEMRNYASFNQFSSWQRFTDVLNNSLIEAEKKNVPETLDALMMVNKKPIHGSNFIKVDEEFFRTIRVALTKAGVNMEESA